MHNHEKLQGPMPSSVRCFTTMCVMQRVDPGIDPYGFRSKCILLQPFYP